MTLATSASCFNNVYDTPCCVTQPNLTGTPRRASTSGTGRTGRRNRIAVREVVDEDRLPTTLDMMLT